MTETIYDVEPGRELRRVTIGAGEARAAVYRREFAADIQDVWEACTQPERLKRWFLELSGDLRVGGRVELTGVVTGQILRCEPPHVARMTWEYRDYPVDEVELRLSQVGPGQTLLELEHATVKLTEEWDGELLDALVNMSSGWEPALIALDLDLRGDLPADNTLASFRARPEIVAAIDRAKAAWGNIVAGNG